MANYEIARPNHAKVINDIREMNLDPHKVLSVLLKWMPDDEIRECMEANEMWTEEKKEE